MTLRLTIDPAFLIALLICQCALVVSFCVASLLVATLLTRPTYSPAYEREPLPQIATLIPTNTPDRIK